MFQQQSQKQISITTYILKNDCAMLNQQKLINASNLCIYLNMLSNKRTICSL